jgi:type IV pilus assembly protein PilA
MLKQVQKGFTLIELMIVVAIIGILAAIAIPAYQDYTVRSQVTEGMNLASAVKAGVAEYYAQTGAWPTDMTLAGGDKTKLPSGKYVTSIDIKTAGTLLITSGGDANTNLGTKTLALQPRLSPNMDVVWLCGYNKTSAATAATLSDPTVPAPAADTNTSVTAKYLPASCRP